MRNEFAKDFPSTDGATIPTYSTEATRDFYTRTWESGTRHSTVVVRHVKDAKLAAYTAVQFKEGSTAAAQQSPWVAKDFRGHHLSTLAKTANALTLAKKGFRYIDTENATNNVEMLATNRRLGFYLRGCEGDFVSVYRNGTWTSA
ncbi:hypothetical protein [Arcanobacterium ihumii]|uniref:hypothetical protein n=1 Tax=Arcanobacterium ihumii TaxID=2138162 RepID=UPI000F51C0E3|nr:hypothetical protein [Arcanobacterium ihumii]